MGDSCTHILGPRIAFSSNSLAQIVSRIYFLNVLEFGYLLCLTAVLGDVCRYFTAVLTSASIRDALCVCPVIDLQGASVHHLCGDHSPPGSDLEMGQLLHSKAAVILICEPHGLPQIEIFRRRQSHALLPGSQSH